MSDGYSVHPGELDAASGRVLELVDKAKRTARALDESLVQMAGTAGQPAVAAALAQVTGAATKAMLDTAALVGFVGQNLKQTAASYDKTDTENAQHLHGKAKGGPS